MAKLASCGNLIKQINDELRKRANNMMRSQDMTMAQIGALLALYHTPEKQLSMKQIEKELHVAQSTCVDAGDKRIKLVRITQAGITRVLETEQEITHAEETLLSSLTETERDILYSLLKKVRESLK